MSSSLGRQRRRRRQRGGASSSSSPRGLPSAFDLSGYVRLLNGAGKIALVAFVDKENGGKVTYVDLVLEKVLTAETHIKWGRKEKRKDMGKNLGKS